MARVDLNPVEEARACAMLVEDLGLTKEEVGRRVGRSRVAISNLIRLLDLPEEVLELIEDGRAQRGPRPRDPDVQGPRRAARASPVDARDEGWSVRETERRAREAEAGRPRRARERAPVVVHPDLAEALAAAEDALAAALGRDGEGARAGRAAAGWSSTSTRPADAVELAERLIGRRRPRAASAGLTGRRYNRPPRGRLAQPVRARL